MQKIENLKVRSESMDLTTEVYEVLRKMPDDEKFGLTSQMKRCAVSIPSNIAEGAGRDSRPDFNRFIGMANGSAYELKTQLMLAQRLKYLTEQDVSKILQRLEVIQKMNYKLKLRLTSNP